MLDMLLAMQSRIHYGRLYIMLRHALAVCTLLNGHTGVFKALSTCGIFDKCFDFRGGKKPWGRGFFFSTQSSSLFSSCGSPLRFICRDDPHM